MNEENSIIKETILEDNVKIFNFCNIYGAKIGSKTKIGSFVEIQRGVEIGKEVNVSSHSFLCSSVKIEDNVFIGHGVITINDIYPPSKKRAGNEKGWKNTLIKEGAVIGSNATLFPVIIGKNSIVGAGSVVITNVPDREIWAGNPAKFIKKNKEENYNAK